MLPAISALGPALLGAFALMELPKLIAGLKEASEWMGGFGKEAREAFADAVKASDDAYVHFKDIKTGVSLRNEVNENIAALETQRDVLDRTGGSALNHARALSELLQGHAAAAAAYVTMARSEQLTTEELAKLEKTRFEQLNQQTKLEAKAHGEHESEARAAADAAYRTAMEAYESNQRAFRASEEALKREMALREHLGKQAVGEAEREEKAREHTAAAIHRLTEELRKQGEQEARNAEQLGRDVSKQIADINHIGEEQERQAERSKNEATQRIEDQHREALAAIQSANQQAQAIAALKGDYKAMADAAIAAYRAMGEANANYLKQLADQHKAEQKAAEESLNAEIAGVGELAEGAARLIGSKRAYYGVKAAEEVAAGIECIAEGTWPPNPLALIAAGVHFESAAEWAKIAGTSARQGSSGGGGGAAGTYGSDVGTRRGVSQREGRGEGYEEEDGGMLPQTLAPGAAGPSGRFGGGQLTVMVVGESEAGHWLAGTLNAAVDRGEYLQSTVSQRGPAVGH
jgi:hypothetical protein